MNENAADRRRIPIRIDDEKYDAPKSTMTGAELKQLGNVPAGYRLFQEVPGPDDKLVNDGDAVELKGGEKFYSLPVGSVGGPIDELIARQFEALKREFPEATIHEDPSGNRHVHVPEVPLPEGWNRERAEVLLQLPPAYPSVAIPGFETDAELRLKNGAQPGGSGFQDFDGKKYMHFCWNAALASGTWRSLTEATRFAVSRFAVRS